MCQHTSQCSRSMSSSLCSSVKTRISNQHISPKEKITITLSKQRKGTQEDRQKMNVDDFLPILEHNRACSKVSLVETTSQDRA